MRLKFFKAAQPGTKAIDLLDHIAALSAELAQVRGESQVVLCHRSHPGRPVPLECLRRK